ncbi:response regulator transcription factor [Cryobacterium luteum]|uniref:Response regulator transcription factor n=1 Tax=Cryobacterium luteum TaxID=1424661 RepID=A0A5F0D0L6_9MICO|nr:response regulator transcription factor [Cryobacterium luteum]
MVGCVAGAAKPPPRKCVREGRDADVKRIVVVEDEPLLAQLLRRILGGAGYTVTVAGTAVDALAAIRAVDPDLIILDLLLPDGRGEDVLTEVMSFRPSSRVLVLSSMTQVATKVGVLNGGAVDFLAKPFANAELLARINTRIRTPASSQASAASITRYLRSSGVSIDLQQREIVVDGLRVPLTQREFMLLVYLLERAPEPCTRAELLEQVWGTKFDTGTNVVDVCVRRLRWKLSNDKIETVRNVGYRITA